MKPGDSVTDGPVSGASALAAVLTPSFLRKLDRLHLAVRGSLSARPGNTPMPRGSQGSGIEIEAYKGYSAGDDLRHLDWNAYCRLGQLLVKTFRAEREAPLHVFIDLSASMSVPASDNKFAFALALAASFAYISLRNHDPVRIVAIGEALPDLQLSSPFFRHRQSLQQLREFLVQLQPKGKTALASGIAAALRQQRSAGVAVVLSDFLTDPGTCESALSELAARRFTVAAARIIGPGERDPSGLFHRAQLLDAETGARRFITLNQENLSRYQQALADHLRSLQSLCNRSGIMFSVADAAAGLERSLFHDLPALGLIR